MKVLYVKTIHTEGVNPIGASERVQLEAGALGVTVTHLDPVTGARVRPVQLYPWSNIHHVGLEPEPAKGKRG